MMTLRRQRRGAARAAPVPAAQAGHLDVGDQHVGVLAGAAARATRSRRRRRRRAPRCRTPAEQRGQRARTIAWSSASSTPIIDAAIPRPTLADTLASGAPTARRLDAAAGGTDTRGCRFVRRRCRAPDASCFGVSTLQRQMRLQAGAATGRRIDAQATAQRLDAFAHAATGRCPARSHRHGRRPRSATRPRRRSTDSRVRALRRARVALDVGHRFAQRHRQHRLHRRRQCHRRAARTRTNTPSDSSSSRAEASSAARPAARMPVTALRTWCQRLAGDARHVEQFARAPPPDRGRSACRPAPTSAPPATACGRAGRAGRGRCVRARPARPGGGFRRARA